MDILMQVLEAHYTLWEMVKADISCRQNAPFLFLFVFRYLRLAVHICSLRSLYKPSPIAANPKYKPSDVTVILPTIDPENNRDFEECLLSALANIPGAIIIVAIGKPMADRTEAIVEKYRDPWRNTKITVTYANVPSKRFQIMQAIDMVRTEITVLLDEHVFWTSNRFLPTILAPFENPMVGIVGTNPRVRRVHKGYNFKSFWNMLCAIHLERHGFETRATNSIDGGVSVVSGRTSAHRTRMILTHPDFLFAFNHERLAFNEVGTLIPDEDHFITRWNVNHGWKIKTQDCPDAPIETSLGAYPMFLKQCLWWSRTTWRSNFTSLFTDRKVWYRQPWCVYAVYISNLFNFALFYDAALLYTFSQTTLCVDIPETMWFLIRFIITAKMVKIIPHLLRHPEDLVFLPGYIVFGYFHSLIKLYALLTCWSTGGIVLQGNTFGGRHDYEGNEIVERTTPLAIEAPAPPAPASLPPQPISTDKDDDNDEAPFPTNEYPSPTSSTDSP